MINQLQELLNRIENISQELGINDIFRNKKFIEVIAANLLGHKVNNKPGGCDAWEIIDGVKYPTEYKSCDCSNDKGSFQFHWLSNNVMETYKETKNIYFIGRIGVNIEYIFTIPTHKLVYLIEEKATGDNTYNARKAFTIKKLKKLGALQVYDRNVNKF